MTLILAFALAAPPEPAPDAPPLVVSSFGGHHDVLESVLPGATVNDPRIPHGLTVHLDGPERRLRDYEVYDRGFLTERRAFAADGTAILHQVFSRKPFDPRRPENGAQTVWGRDAKGDTIAVHGHFLDGKRHAGRFVVFAELPKARPDYNRPDLALFLHEYEGGKLVKSEPAPDLGFGERATSQKWLRGLPRQMAAERY